MSKRTELHEKLAACVQGLWGIDVNHFLANQRSAWVERLTADYASLNDADKAQCLTRASVFLEAVDQACPGWDKEAPAPVVKATK